VLPPRRCGASAPPPRVPGAGSPRCRPPGARDAPHPEERELGFQAGRRAAAGAPGGPRAAACRGRAGAQGGDPRSPRGWQRQGPAGARQSAGGQEGCLRATSCHFVSVQRAAFPLSRSAVPGLALPLLAAPRGAARGIPSGKRPAGPGVFPATSALGARGFAGCSADLLLIATTHDSDLQPLLPPVPLVTPSPADRGAAGCLLPAPSPPAAAAGDSDGAGGRGGRRAPRESGPPGSMRCPAPPHSALSGSIVASCQRPRSCRHRGGKRGWVCIWRCRQRSAPSRHAPSPGATDTKEDLVPFKSPE